MTIGSRPSVGRITAALSRQVRKRQSERVPRACSRDRCRLRPSTHNGTKTQSKPACAALLRTRCQRQSRSAKEQPVHLISAGESMLDLPNFSCAETPSKLSRERLRRACKRANSSFPRQLNVELLPTFATVGAVVKLSVRRAEIKATRHPMGPSQDRS